MISSIASLALQRSPTLTLGTAINAFLMMIIGSHLLFDISKLINRRGKHGQLVTICHIKLNILNLSLLYGRINISADPAIAPNWEFSILLTILLIIPFY